MEWPDRNFDGKSNDKTPEDHILHSCNWEAEQRALSGSPFCDNGSQIKGPEESAKQLNAEQESKRSTHRINHEFDRSVVPVVASPLIDEEVHRHEADFPEDEKDQQVKRHEDAEHAGFEEEEQHQVWLDAI